MLVYKIFRTMRAPAKTFRDLIVWQKAHEFVLAVYPFSESFPRKGNILSLFSISSSRYLNRRKYRRGIRQTEPGRQGQIFEHRSGLTRRMPILRHLERRLRVRQD